MPRTKTEAKERALSALAAALKPGDFLKWLTPRRSRSLLSHASVMLKQISGGRYAFADPEEADAQWHVLDNDTGQARSPASLSGGEQFIASLALALGMVEMMARSGGRLESLFLDEGFGSLDRNNLDAAVEALAMIATRGRMVVHRFPPRDRQHGATTAIQYHGTCEPLPPLWWPPRCNRTLTPTALALHVAQSVESP